MPLVAAWCKVCIYFGFVFAWTKGARPRFDTSTDMGLVLVPADAEVDSVIFRLRATDQDADFPLVFEITATITPVVRIDNLPCTLYNKVCQANVILTKRLIPGRLHDFAVRVRDTKGDSNSMQATISVTNSTTPRDKIFPHIPSLIMVPEDTKPGKELDYLLVRANSWSGKPVYIELWQPKELFTIRQRQTPTQTRGIITLIGELDFETQSMYTLTMYATDPYTEPGKDTRNIAGLNVVVVVQDVQDVPPIFTLAPPLTRINNSVQPGDIILRVHAEDGDKGVPREIVYGLVSEGNPFTPFFNISETNGEIVLARPLEELTQITHVGAPVVLTVVAEEIRRSREEPPAQATIVEVGFLLGEPGNSPPYFESDNYVATIDENLEPGTAITFGEQYSTRVRDEDIGKAGVFALKLENNNGTFEINPTVAERTADFIITVRDNTLIDYELYKSLFFKIIAQEVGPATNLSTSVPVTIFLRDVNDNPPVFDEQSYEVTLSENVTAGTRVVQVHATDKDTGLLGSVRYTRITGEGSEAFIMDPDTGLITVAMGSSLDREIAPRLLLSVEARDENGNGNRGTVPLIVNLLDVNDNAPLFERDVYEFMLNSELTNFTTPAFIKAIDADAEPPNNVVRYELVHGNYENKFYLNEITGELVLRSPITKIRRKKQSAYEHFSRKTGKEFVKGQDTRREVTSKPTEELNVVKFSKDGRNNSEPVPEVKGIINKRRKRANEDALYTLTARAYDLGVPHLSSVTQIRILSGIAMEARIVMFVVPGEHPDSKKTAETLATITGGRVTVLETRPYQQNVTGTGNVMPGGGKKSIVIARVEQTEPGTPLVDVEKIRETLAANGVGIIAGMDNVTNTMTTIGETKPPVSGTHGNDGQTTNVNNTITNVYNEEVTVYKAENKLLFWLLIILGLLMLLAIAALIICCICPGCPFYMAPRKRRVHSSETLVVRTDGRPKRHIHRRPATLVDAMWNGRKQAWSADPTRRNWQFNRRNTKNCGLSSLPGDVALISGQGNDIHVNVEPLRLRDGPAYDPSRRSRIGEQERMYVEDVDGQKVREYEAPELDSLQRHEMERGADVPRQGYRHRYIEPDTNDEPEIREQHFYREGNAEVLRLVTRGQIDDTAVSHHHHQHRHPTTLIVDGKDILLKRFMDDQKSRHDLSMPDIEATRSMESHQRPKEICQQQREIILIPERLDLGHRQHVDELGPNVQRLVIDHSDYGSQKLDAKEAQIREAHRQERQETIAPGASMTERPTIHAKEHAQATNAQSYSFHDLELARQNALLTRLLLERENRHVSGVVDSTSYLETQSLPGQVAIATQTDRTAATQTDRHVRSRSDNDESDEESRSRKKLKSKKKYGDGDWKRTRTLWMKSPIEEEVGPCFDKRLSILRKKVREVKEGRKIPLEPNVLREISDSLDGNGSSYRGEEEESTRTYQRSEQTSIRYKVSKEQENDSPSSMEMRKGKYDRGFDEKTRENELTMDATESTSSPEIKIEREEHSRGKVGEKSPRKEAKAKAHRKSEGVIKPSFRILEREITMLGKKLSKLGDKKFQESAGSDSTSLEKPGSMSKESRRDSDQKGSKKMDASSSRGQKQSTGLAGASKTEQSQRKEAAITKTRQKFKYQQTQVMSTGSSEYDESFEKPRKQSSGFIQESSKQKASGGYAKMKRQVDRRETKRQVSQHQDQDTEKRKEGTPKGTPRSESNFERSGKPAGRAPKLALVSRRDHVSEELSTSTNSDRVVNGKDMSELRESDKKSNSESSGNGSSGPSQRKGQQVGGQVIERIIQRFVEGPIERVIEQTTADSQKQETKEEKETREMSSGLNGRGKLQECKLESIVKDVEQRMTVDLHTRDVTEKKKISEESADINGKGKLSEFKLDEAKVLVENSDKENQQNVIKGTVDRDFTDRVTDDYSGPIAVQKEESELIKLRSKGDERYDKRDLSAEFAMVVEEAERCKEKDELGEMMINVEESRVDRSMEDKKVDETLSESKTEMEDDKSSEEIKKPMEKTRGEIEKCKERGELLGDAKEKEEVSREVGKHDLSFIHSGKEIQERMVDKFQEIIDIDRLLSDKNHGVDSKSDTRRDTKTESEKQGTMDTSIDTEKDHARRTDESVDKIVEAMLPKVSKESITNLKTDESEKGRKEEKLIEAAKQEEETKESSLARDVSHDHDVREKNIFLGPTEIDARDITPVRDVFLNIPQEDDHRVVEKEVVPETRKIDDHDDSPKRDISPQISVADDRQAKEKNLPPEASKIDDRDISPQSDVPSKLSQDGDHHASEKIVPPDAPKFDDQNDSPQKDISPKISQADHRHLSKTDILPETPKIESHDVGRQTDVSPQISQADHRAIETDVPPETSKIDDDDVSRQRDVPPETFKIDSHGISPQGDLSPKISQEDHHHVTEKDVPVEIPIKIDDGPQKDVSPKISPADHHRVTEKDSPEISKIDDHDISLQSDIPPEISEEDHHHRVIKKDIPPEISQEDHNLRDPKKDVSLEASKIDHDIIPQKDVPLAISQADDHRVTQKDVSPEVPKTHDQRINEKKDVVPEVTKIDDSQIDNVDRAKETEATEYSTPDALSPKTLQIPTLSDDENLKKHKSGSSSDDNDEDKRKHSHPKIDTGISQHAQKDSSLSKDMEEKSGKSDNSDALTDDKLIISRKSETEEEHESKESEKSKDSLPVEVKTSPVEERKSSEDFFGDKLILTDETSLAEMETPFDSSDKKIETSLKDSSEQSAQFGEPSDDKSSKSKKIKDPEDEEKLQVSTIDDFQETKSFRILSPTSETIVKEVPELDLVKSITVDGTKLSETDSRLKPEIEETKLQEVDQFRGEQSSSAREGKSLPPLEDQLSGEREASKTDWHQSSKGDLIEKNFEKPLNSEESFTEETDKDEGGVGERYADVSFPLFTSIIDTVDDSDESDSSSDISRKTTLTTRPYHTPRHRAARTPEKESVEMVGKTEMNIVDSDEEGTLMIELVDDKNGELSVDEESKREIEDIDTDRYIAMPLIPTTGEEDISESREEVGTASGLQIPPVRDKALSRADAGSTRKRKSLESKSSLETDERLSENSKHSKDEGMKQETRNRGRTNGGKTAQTSNSGNGKTESRGSNGRSVKQTEKMKPPPRKKSSPDESGEEKPTLSQDHAQSRYRSHQQRGDQVKRKDVDQGKRKDADQEKQKHADQEKQNEADQGKQKHADQSKQSRKPDEDQRRKQTTSRSRSEKFASPPKTGEFDTSKAQPKYMAWYKQKREEMERKRAELRATDDEDQLPRWLRRSMKNQKLDKDEKTKDRGAAEITPRTRRKIKPLVNVESEQLKAIVRQGRKLRRAEGGGNEDPPIQIFATTPPEPPPSDAKHRLVQHSEYKYEKIPPPFYLHPPPAPHPSPQLSPERFDAQPRMERGHSEGDLDPGIAMSHQGGNRLRHQQLLEKKSVFDIAYSEAAPSQLRADSTTPPS